MSYSLPLLVWLRTFEAAARHLGFAQAADELGVTPASVSQQVRSLEAHLGVALFERLPRGVRLTTLGRAYYPSVRKALDDLTVSTASLFGGAAGRRVTIRCAVSYAALRLAPRLADFRARHPDIRVRLYASIWGDDAEEGQVDLEIRYGRGQWEGFDATSLAAPVSVPVVPPHLAGAPDPAGLLRRMAREARIDVVGCERMWPDLAERLGWGEPPPAAGVVVDTSLLALELTASGQGCALIANDLAEAAARSGRVAILPDIALRHDESHFLLASRVGPGPSPDALVFRDWLLREAGNVLQQPQSSAHDGLGSRP